MNTSGISEPQHIRERVEEGDWVAFVGAGLSIPPAQGWDATVASIAAQCGVDFDRARDDVKDVIDACIRKSEESCRTALASELPRYSARMRGALKVIPRLPFKAILTPNFDPYLRDHCEGKRWQLSVYPDLRPMFDITGSLCYLHGVFNADNPRASVEGIVFGRRSFEVAYKDSLLPGFLLDILVYENVLFLGFEPREPFFQEVLKRSMRVRTELQARCGRPDPARVILYETSKDRGGDATSSRAMSDAHGAYERLGLTPVAYDPIDVERTGLDRILGGWLDRTEGGGQPPAFPGWAWDQGRS